MCFDHCIYVIIGNIRYKLIIQNPWENDRYMSPDFNEVTDLVRTEKVWNAVNYHAKQVHSELEP